MALAEQFIKYPGSHQVKVVGIDFSGDPSVSYNGILTDSFPV